jgi:hypothetical protein
MQRIDAWIRRRLRCFLPKQWKRPKSRAEALRKLGAQEPWTIISSKGLWRLSKTRSVTRGSPEPISRRAAFTRSVMHGHNSFECAEPPYTGPYVRWCEREGQEWPILPDGTADADVGRPVPPES